MLPGFWRTPQASQAGFATAYGTYPMQANERHSTGQPVIITIAGKRGVEQMSSVVAVCVAIATIALVILMLREGAYL
ncbi:MAG: hypothetical protein C4335_02400 [Armatimonadota bacterium]